MITSTSPHQSHLTFFIPNDSQRPIVDSTSVDALMNQ